MKNFSCSTSFDKYQRYRNASKIIENIREQSKCERFKILEVGANVHRLLEEFLPFDDISYLDMEIPQELMADPKFIQGDACDLAFEDNSYDIIVALDVMEHIPIEKREKFITEIYRTSRLGSIIIAPFQSTEAIAAEMRLNDNYKLLYGDSYRWLKEHIDNGLPKISEIERVLIKNDIKYSVFSHGDIVIWEKLMLASFYASTLPTLSKYIDEINSFYNKYIFEYDYVDNSYRKIITCFKEYMINPTNIICPDIDNRSDICKLNELISEFYQHLFHSVIEKIENRFNLTRYLANSQNSFLFYKNEKHEELVSIKSSYFPISDRSENIFACRFTDIPRVNDLRFDPIDGFSSKIKIVNIVSNINDISIQQLNATNRSGDWDEFLHTDPIYEIKGDFLENSFIEITFEVDFIDFVDALENLYKKTLNIPNLNNHINILLQSERQLKADSENKNAIIERLSTNEVENKKALEEKDASIAFLDKELNDSVEENKSLGSQLAQKSDENIQLSTELRNKTAHIEQLVQSERELQRSEHELSQDITNKKAHIEQLLIVERELNNLKKSRSYRVMQFFWKARAVVFPIGSKRSLFAGLCFKFAKHPIRFIKKASPKRIKTFFKTLKNEGAATTAVKVNNSLIDPSNISAPIVVDNLPNEVKSDSQSYESLKLPIFDKPLVSIIIPVYNQFDYTYLCIKSIIENTRSTPYEVIIADDCSNDKTTDIENIVQGVKLVRTPHNMRFLLNCNNAAQYANGKYIFFLNNDTQVQQNWLSSLVELIESNDSIGMVGSKLVYPDGKLQEAGGILWKDGSAWNYGNRQDPNLPEFNYVKEADYISGAAIMIKKSLWKDIGGFDERFVPAYCEDSDLAFEVRKRGYKVMYQPKSIVVHFEGVSNGTDTSSGQKAYQVINSQKFFDKWKDVLEAEHFPNGENVFLARDRSRNKKTILVVDHYVPQYDKDAGSRTVDQYLDLLVNMGYNVKFLGDNFHYDPDYAPRLEQKGIELLCGVYYRDNWKRWIKSNSSNIDFAYLNRPHIAINYIDFLREHTKAKIVYYGHDLHYLRLKRGYEISDDKEVLVEAEKWKKIEYTIMKKADMVYYPSYIEVEEIHSNDADIKAKAIPAYLYKKQNLQDFDYKNRKDIMFIGGFSHNPNIDGIKWFADEVLPFIVEKIPNIKVHIIGSNPPESVKKLSGTNITIVGYVNDDELEKYYNNCVMSIVPLRYGAGVKGKVIEAMKYGLPVVTTSVGAEGIDCSEALVVADPPKNFADSVIELYYDESKLIKLSAESIDYVNRNYTLEKAREIIIQDF